MLSLLFPSRLVEAVVRLLEPVVRLLEPVVVWVPQAAAVVSRWVAPILVALAQTCVFLFCTFFVALMCTMWFNSRNVRFGRRHWKALGCSDDEIHRKRDDVCMLVFVTTMVFVGQVPPGADASFAAVSFSATRCCLAFAHAVVVCGAWFAHAFATPPPWTSEDGASQKLGSAVYFPTFVACVQAGHGLVSFVGEASLLLSPKSRWLASSCRNSALLAANSLAATAIFFKWHWRDPAWRREELDPWRGRGYPVGRVFVATHLVSFPAAVFDLLVVKRPKLLRDNSLPVYDFATFLYITLFNYLLFVNVIVKQTWGLYPYPAMHNLTKPRHWLAVFLSGVVLLLAVVLPAVLALQTIATGHMAPIEKFPPGDADRDMWHNSILFGTLATVMVIVSAFSLAVCKLFGAV